MYVLRRRLSLLAILVVMAAVVARYRRTVGLERERMRWLAWAVTAMGLLGTAGFVVDLGRFEAVLFFVVINLAPVAMTIAVLDPGLVDIDDLLARTLTYGGLAVVIVVVDIAVLAALTLAILPVLVLYLLFSRQLIRGITAGAVK